MSGDEGKFDRIVAHARETNPFYHEWLKDSVPILTRRVLLENNDLILNGHPVSDVTSGSTGIPVRVAKSPQRQRLGRKIRARFIDWFGGPKMTSRIVYPRGHPPELSANTPIDEQIEWLIQRYQQAGATVLLTYPTNAMMLAQTIRETDVDLSFLEQVGLVGESADRNERAYVQRGFPNALVWSVYGANEVGVISGQCPHASDFHHIMTDCFRVEVLDDEDRPCSEGEVGRIVITDYFNDWSPLIRYEIGDLAVRGTCPCGGISLPAFSEILGKVRGTLKHRDGRRVMFIDLSVALRDLPGMKQYQVVQETLERFTVRLVIDRPREEEIAAAFEDHFGYRPQLTFEYHDFIEREPSGKFHASICRV